MYLLFTLLICLPFVIHAIDITDCSNKVTLLNNGDSYNIVPKTCSYAFMGNPFIFSTISLTNQNPSASITVTYQTIYGNVSYDLQTLGDYPVPPTNFWISVQTNSSDFNITVTAANVIAPYAVNRTVEMGTELFTIIRGDQIPNFALTTVTTNNENLVVRVVNDSKSVIDIHMGIYVFIGNSFLSTAADIYNWQSTVKGPLYPPGKEVSFLTLKNLELTKIRTTLLIGDSSFDIPDVIDTHVFVMGTPPSSVLYPFQRQNTTSAYYFLSYDLASSENRIEALSYNKTDGTKIEIYAGCVAKQLPNYLLATIDTEIKPELPLDFRGPCRTIIVPANTDIVMRTSIKDYTDEPVLLGDGGDGYIMSRSYPYTDTFSNINTHKAHINGKNDREFEFTFEMIGNSYYRDTCVDVFLNGDRVSNKSYCITPTSSQVNGTITAKSIVLADDLGQSSGGYLMRYSYKYTSASSQLGFFAVFCVILKLIF